jgi:hypothetical protein
VRNFFLIDGLREHEVVGGDYDRFFWSFALASCDSRMDIR